MSQEALCDLKALQQKIMQSELHVKKYCIFQSQTPKATPGASHVALMNLKLVPTCPETEDPSAIAVEVKFVAMRH